MQQAHQPLYAICFIFIKSNVTAAVFVHKTEKGKEPTLYKVTVLVSGFFMFSLDPGRLKTGKERHWLAYFCPQ